MDGIIRLKKFTDKKFLDTIIDAVNNNKLVVFIGSGVSKLCGLPLWGELAKRLLDECVICFKDKGYDYSFSNKILVKNYDPKKIITIIKNIFSKFDCLDKFYEILVRELSFDNAAKFNETEKQNKVKLKDIISHLSRKIVTTNADTLFDDLVDEQHLITSVEKFYDEMFSDDFSVIAHIHGSITDTENLVFTTDKYLQTYANERFRNTIKHLFEIGEHTILFIGYGLSELELLDFLVNTGVPSDRLNRTFLLNGYFNCDEDMVKEEEDYYKIYGISLITYELDKNSYGELINVLDYIKHHVQTYSELMVENIDEILKIFSEEPTNRNIQTILNRYSFLNTDEKKIFGNYLMKSPFLEKWIKEIVSNEKILEKIKIREIISNELNIHPSLDDKDYLKLALLSTPHFYIEGIDEIYHHVINFSVNLCKNNQKILNDRDFVVSVMNILYSNSQTIGEDVSLDFAKLLAETQYLNYMVVLFYNYTNVFFGLKIQDTIDYLKTIICSNNVDYFHLEMMYTAFHDYFSKNAAKETFGLLFDYLTKKFDEEKMSYETFERSREISANTNYKVIKKWLSSLIAHLDDKTASHLYKKYHNEKNIFSILTSIYIANTHFSILKDDFLNDLKHLIQKQFFSEIYSYFNKNASYLNENDLELYIFDYLKKISFGSYYLEQISRLDLLKLLKIRFPNLDYEISNLEGLLSTSEKTEYNRAFSNPLNRSKNFIVRADFSNSANINENELLKLNPSEFIDVVKKKMICSDIYTISTVSSAFTKYKFKGEIYDEFLSNKKDKLPDDFILILISQIFNLNKSLEEKIDVLVRLKKSLTISSQNYHFLNSLFVCLIYTKENLSEKTKDKIFNIVYHIDTNDDTVALLFNNTRNLTLESSETFLKYSIMTIVCTQVNWNILSSAFVSSFNNFDVTSSIIKASAAQFIYRLYDLDKTWTELNIKHVFNNEYYDTNYSFVAYAHNEYIRKNFVLDLIKNNIFKKLLTSNDFDIYSHSFSSRILFMFLEDSDLLDATKIIISCEHYAYDFEHLLELLNNENKSLFNADNFKSLVQMIIRGNLKVKHLDFAGRTLLKYCNLIKEKALILDFCKFAFSFENDSMLSVEIFNYAYYGVIDKKILPEIIYYFLKNIENCYNATNHLVLLFNLMNVDKKRKQEVKNHLLKKNPGLVSKLKVE